MSEQLTGWAEERLPAELLALATRRGSEWAWPLHHVPTVIAAARELNLVTLGGQIQFRFPEGTYELYWLNADSAPPREGETWAEYVSRSAEEVLNGVRRLPSTVEELEQEIRRWPGLAAEARRYGDLSPFLCFALSLVAAGDPCLDGIYPAT